MTGGGRQRIREDSVARMSFLDRGLGWNRAMCTVPLVGVVCFPLALPVGSTLCCLDDQ